MALVICPDCGKEQDNVNRFCRNCGADLSDVEPIVHEETISTDETMLVKEEISTDSIEEKTIGSTLRKCPDCGTELNHGANFCPNCGANVKNISNLDATPTTVDAGSNLNATPTTVDAGSNLDATPTTVDTSSNLGSSQTNVGTINQPTVTTIKNPWVAAILSFVFPGFGQLYLGQKNKAGLFIVIAAVSIVLMLLIVGFILYILFWLWGIFDAYSSAIKLNNGEIVEDKLF